jgi:phenylpropionate dioxygenase-like ring-hydroxylating dioxygenase large terminal subunit
VGGPGEGWVRIGDSSLPAGGILGTTLADEDLVIWRSMAGTPCVAEARCPHQWSHLAGEGAVDGEELVCLTHLWRFTVDGEGWKENASGRRDRKGDLAVKPCVERDGGIWVQVRG